MEVLLLFVCFFTTKTWAYWVSLDPHATHLLYKTLSNGDRIMDFSAVGYKQGLQPFPSPPILTTLYPSGHSDAPQLEQAIAHLSSLPPDPATGLRGTIKLASGSFDLRGASILINQSGIVVQGSGSDEKGTLLRSNSTSGASPLFLVTGAGSLQEVGQRSNVTRTVPSGTATIQVDGSTGFHEGDEVVVCWPQTAAWIEMMQMTKAWVNWTDSITCVERKIAQMKTATMEITVDIPIPFRIDVDYLDQKHAAYISRFQHPGRIHDVGLSDFRAVNDVVGPHGAGTFFVMAMAEDSWASNLVGVDFGGDTVTVAGKRITVQDVHLIRTIPAPPTGPKPADIAMQYPGSQILVANTSSKGDHEFNFLTRDGVNGPNVFYNCTGYGSAIAQPHSHWATGLLYDNVNLPESRIEMINRNTINSRLDHGIAIGYGVAWHTNSSTLTILNPPGAANWAIGYSAAMVVPPQNGEQGILDPNGISSHQLLSLYIAQKTFTSIHT